MGARNTKRYEVRKVEILNPDEQKMLNKFYFYATTLLTYSGVGCTSQTAYRSR